MTTGTALAEQFVKVRNLLGRQMAVGRVGRAATEGAEQQEGERGA